MTLRIGTSGWSYPGGRGSWNGIFYPLKSDRSSSFDELSFYAERFNTVEVNSTFYGQPRLASTLAWVKRTPADFDFSLKLYQKFTHPATAVDRSPISQADIDAFRGGIEPLAAGGRLGVVLAQFPSRFTRTPEAREYLDWLLSTFADYPMAVELRHRSWSDEATDTLSLLEAHDTAWAQIDEPKFSSSIEQDHSAFALALRRDQPNVESVYYMRLHGRNAAHWWENENSEDRYNYLYSEEELRPIADVMREARAAVRKAYLYLNNHFAAQAVADAAMLRDLLDEPVTTPLPAELVSRYPMLEGRVPTLSPSRLL
jgi:uncharacterized protein YecE (DUF72 family)